MRERTVSRPEELQNPVRAEQAQPEEPRARELTPRRPRPHVHGCWVIARGPAPMRDVACNPGGRAGGQKRGPAHALEFTVVLVSRNRGTARRAESPGHIGAQHSPLLSRTKSGTQTHLCPGHPEVSPSGAPQRTHSTFLRVLSTRMTHGRVCAEETHVTGKTHVPRARCVLMGRHTP